MSQWWIGTEQPTMSSVRGIQRSPVNSPHKGQWRGALMFSLICAWTNGWVNNRDAGDLRRHRTHYHCNTVMRTLIALWVVGLSKLFNKTIELAVIRKTMWPLCGVTVIFKQISTSFKNCFAAPSRQSNNNTLMIFIATWPTETVSKEKNKIVQIFVSF